MIDTVRTPLTFDRLTPDRALERALALTRPEVIAAVSASGLKGRGGAGFPTGVKWNLAAAAAGREKVVIGNADEGEPGTFKDRVLLSRFPDLVFEGMSIAGYAIRAHRGILYLRGEYAWLRGGLEQVLASRRERGLLGNAVLGRSDFAFDIDIRMGAGAYVCGEETALIESLEGQRGEPRNRPPFPVDTGFMHRPSTVNNVESLVWVTAILAHGAEWFRGFGTERSAGRKLLSVSGDCARPGVYEVGLGITIAEVLHLAGGEGAQAVQVGGAAGECVMSEHFERRVAYEDVPAGGSFIVIGPRRDMLAVAQNFLEFFVDESCGQCTPCRLGTRHLLQTVERIREGLATPEDLRTALQLGETMRLASKCGLGQSAPNTFVCVVQPLAGGTAVPGARP